MRDHEDVVTVALLSCAGPPFSPRILRCVGAMDQSGDYVPDPFLLLFDIWTVDAPLSRHRKVDLARECRRR